MVKRRKRGNQTASSNDKGNGIAGPAADAVGVAIGPLTQLELKKMTVKAIKTLLKEKGIKVTARTKEILIQRYLRSIESDFYPLVSSSDGDGANRFVKTGSNEETWKAYCARLTEERVLELGLEFANYSEHQQSRVQIDTNRTRFRAHNSVGPKAIAALIKDLPPQKKFVLYELFMALSFANTYNSEEVHAGNWAMCPDKVKDCVEFYLKKKQFLKNKNSDW